jgi:hypothetical protein
MGLTNGSLRPAAPMVLGGFFSTPAGGGTAATFAGTVGTPLPLAPEGLAGVVVVFGLTALATGALPPGLGLTGDDPFLVATWAVAVWPAGVALPLPVKVPVTTGGLTVAPEAAPLLVVEADFADEFGLLVPGLDDFFVAVCAVCEPLPVPLVAGDVALVAVAGDVFFVLAGAVALPDDAGFLAAAGVVVSVGCCPVELALLAPEFCAVANVAIAVASTRICISFISIPFT